MNTKKVLIYVGVAMAAGAAALLLSKNPEVIVKAGEIPPVKKMDYTKTENTTTSASTSIQKEKQMAEYDKDMAELEKISAELLAYKNRVGDDPAKMTNKEIEDQVVLMDAYNRQFEIVIKKAKEAL